MEDPHFKVEGIGFVLEHRHLESSKEVVRPLGDSRGGGAFLKGSGFRLFGSLS
ncbi:hypothetical protein CK203_088189 [Vitis vinifera]|uniref:Uncharacterized protein n=1 Tax=Vitis vinifera TaxID=29760 RepID=A0A438DPF7_VITVI|nr:hypothetical protein CK203_088189 [Vitis vinifera]